MGEKAARADSIAIMKLLKTIVPILVGIAALAVLTWLPRLTTRGDCCQGAKLPPPRQDTHPRPASDTNAVEYWKRLGYD